MKVRITMLAVVLACAAIFGVRQVKARPQEMFAPSCVVEVPAEWGEFKTVYNFGMVFEDKSGTLRVTDQLPCSGVTPGQVPKVSIEVRRK